MAVGTSHTSLCAIIYLKPSRPLATETEHNGYGYPLSEHQRLYTATSDSPSLSVPPSDIATGTSSVSLDTAAHLHTIIVAIVVRTSILCLYLLIAFTPDGAKPSSQNSSCTSSSY